MKITTEMIDSLASPYSKETKDIHDQQMKAFQDSVLFKSQFAMSLAATLIEDPIQAITSIILTS